MAGFVFRASVGGISGGGGGALDKAPLRLDYRGTGSNPGGFVKDAAKGLNEGLVILSDLVDLNDNAPAADARSLVTVLTQNQDAAEGNPRKYEQRLTGAWFSQIRVGNALSFYPITTFQTTNAAWKFGAQIDGALGTPAGGGLDFHDVSGMRIPSVGLMLPVRSRTGSIKNINYPVDLIHEALEEKESIASGVTIHDTLLAFPADCIPLAVAWRVNTTIAGPANMNIGTIAVPTLFATAAGVAVSNNGFKPASAFFAPLVATVIRFTFNIATTDALGRIGLLLYYIKGNAVTAQDASFDSA